MNQINVITDNPSQTMILRLETGQSINFDLFYSYNQSGWFFNLTYGSFIINGKRIVNSPNLLREFRNILPFGLSCTVADKHEPVFIDDFKNGRAVLYTLNQSDVDQIESLIAAGK